MTLLTPTPAGCPVELIPARSIGHTSRAVRTGELVAVTRGVYAPARAWAALAPWDRYLARVHAAATQHPDAVFCLESAASLRGLPVFGDPLQVHVLGASDRTSRVTGGVAVHVTADDRGVEDLGGILVTAAPDTVVDIARFRHDALALAAADAALRADSSLTVEQLVAANESRASSRGRRRARWPLLRASPLAETALESVDRAVIEWLGFPDPELQVWTAGDRVDKWWPGFRIAGEGDGDLKYDGRFGNPGTALRKRHERDARLFDAGARAVPHWGWPEVLAAAPLRAILRSAGLPLIRPEEKAPLFALRRALSTSRPPV